MEKYTVYRYCTTLETLHRESCTDLYLFLIHFIYTEGTEGDFYLNVTEKERSGGLSLIRYRPRRRQMRAGRTRRGMAR